MQAKAVVFPQANQVEFVDVTCPDPGPDDVVVRVSHSWISNGTESSYLRGERVAGDTARRADDPQPFPVVPGYQKVGVVKWVGENIKDLQKGETVFAALGHVNDMFEPGGGHISPTVCRRDQVWKLPQNIDPVAFSALVLTQVGYNCGSRAKINPGDSAVVIGDGMVGQWAAQTLAWRGAKVIMVGRHDQRLKLFRDKNNGFVVNAKNKDWIESLQKALPKPPAAVVDTAGSIAALTQTAPLLKRGGAIVSAGFYGTNDQLALQPLRAGEITVHLVSGWTKPRMDKTLALIAEGKLNTLNLITHRFSPTEAKKAWDLITTRSEPVLGVVLDWQQKT